MSSGGSNDDLHSSHESFGVLLSPGSRRIDESDSGSDSDSSVESSNEYWKKTYEEKYVLKIQSLVRRYLSIKYTLEDDFLLIQRKRSKICREIFETEKTYVDNLQTLVEIVVDLKSLVGTKNEVLTASQIKIMFGTIEPILGCNLQLLELLREQHYGRKVSTQSSETKEKDKGSFTFSSNHPNATFVATSSPNISLGKTPLGTTTISIPTALNISLGSVLPTRELPKILPISKPFLELAPFLKCYVDYVNNYDNSIKLLRELKAHKKDSPWNIFLLNTNKRLKDKGKEPLGSFFIMPVQRIPRYKLLLKDLVKHTSSEHVDYQNLIEAYHSIDAIADIVNARKQDAEEQEKCWKVIDRCWKTTPEKERETLAMAPHRRFIREGYLRETSAKDHDKTYFTLFNDLILYTTIETKKSFLSFRTRKGVNPFTDGGLAGGGGNSNSSTSPGSNISSGGGTSGGSNSNALGGQELTNEEDVHKFVGLMVLNQKTTITNIPDWISQANEASGIKYAFALSDDKVTWTLSADNNETKDSWIADITEQTMRISMNKQSFQGLREMKWMKQLENKRMSVALGVRPTELCWHSGNEYKKKMFVIAGTNTQYLTNKLFVFDLEKLCWISVSSKGKPLSARGHHRSEVVGHHLAIFGGTNGFSQLNDLITFNLETYEWRLYNTSSSIKGRAGHSWTCWQNRFLILFGGRTKNRVYLNELLLFDFETKNWYRVKTTGPLPKPRGWHSATLVKDQIFIFGGLTDSDEPLSDLWCLQLGTFTWEQHPANGDSTSPRWGHSTDVLFSDPLKLLVFGGMISNGQFNNQLAVYDIKSKSWFKPTGISGIPSVARAFHTTIPVNSKIVFFGGLSRNGPLDNIIALDTGLKFQPPEETKGKYAIENFPMELVCTSKYVAPENEKKSLSVKSSSKREKERAKTTRGTSSKSHIDHKISPSPRHGRSKDGSSSSRERDGSSSSRGERDGSTSSRGERDGSLSSRGEVGTKRANTVTTVRKPHTMKTSAISGSTIVKST